MQSLNKTVRTLKRNAAAKQAITQVMAKGSPSPKLMPTGGGGGSSTRKGSIKFQFNANTLERFALDTYYPKDTNG